MRTVHTMPAVDAALRELSPRAERLLRMRFGIGSPTRRCSALISGRRLRQLEASALRTLRLNALGSPPGGLA